MVNQQSYQALQMQCYRLEKQIERQNKLISELQMQCEAANRDRSSLFANIFDFVTRGKTDTPRIRD